MDRTKLENFYRNWSGNLDKLSEGYIYDNEKKLKPTRTIFLYFKNIINSFLTNKLNELEKIILLPGIRGVGKTTVLMQILKIEKFLNQNIPLDLEILKNISKLEQRFYLDVSKLHLEQISLNDFFNFFQDVNGFNFVDLNRKTILLLDEIHFDEKWGLFLKTLFDITKNHNNLLVIATGSSAINIKMNADLMRRASVVEVFPMDFREYLNLKYKTQIENNNLNNLKDIILTSKNARDVFLAIKKSSAEIEKIFVNLPYKCEDEFLRNGGFPFTLGIQNQFEILGKIKDVINGIIAKDILTLRKFRTETVSKIGDLLYLLANSDLISYEKLLKTLHIDNIRTLYALLDVLIISGLIVRIKSFGKTYGSTRRTPKYLFITPSLRSAILDDNFYSGIEGKKLEDYFVLVFEKYIRSSVNVYKPNLFYDASEEGADFILNLGNNNIIVEVGFNKDETRQVEHTMKKIKNVKYGLIFGSSELRLFNDKILNIPLKFLLLI